jgi:uncharacterized membrane protein YgdD (TMEM256/DUF423 family)
LSVPRLPVLDRTWLVCAGLSGGLAVALGAFAAHGLEGRFPADRLDWIETGARYQVYHALALAVAALARQHVAGVARRLLTVAGAAFLLGALLFPGGLYLAALAGWTWPIPVVPVGGVAFLAGWLALAAAGLLARPGGG